MFDLRWIVLDLMNVIANKIDKFFEEEIKNTTIHSLDDFDRLLNIFITRECIYRKINIDAESICFGIHDIIRQFGNDYFNEMTPIAIYKYSSARYIELKIKEDYRYNIYYKMFENPYCCNEVDIQTSYNNPESI